MENKVAELRKKAGLTQVDLAKRIGISRQALISIEKGANPSGETLLKIASILRTKVENIFFTVNVLQEQQKEENK